MIINDCVLDLENSIDLEPGAATWYDLSRYKNNGTITAGAGGWVQLPSGLWAYEFDGAASFVDFGNPASILSHTRGSISCWLKGSGYIGIACQNGAGGGTNEWYLQVDGANNRLVDYYTDGGVVQHQLLTANGTLDDTLWNHLVFQSSGTTCTCYINGVLTALVVGGGANNGDWFDDNALFDIVTLGSSRRAPPLYYTGLIASPVIHTYMFTAGQARNTYESEKHLVGVA